MTVYYVDPSSPTNGNGTETNPYNVIPGTLVAGNSYLYKKGTIFIPSAATQAIQVGQGGTSNTNRVTLGSYGDGALPIIDCRNTARGINIGSNDLAYITIENLHITNVAASTSRRGITNTVPSPKTTNTSIILSGLVIDNIITDGVNDCNAISLRGANNIIRNCIINNIADDGIWYHGDNILIDNCKITNVAQSGRVAGDNIQCGGASDFGTITNNYLDHSNAGSKQCYIHNTASNGLIFDNNICIGYPDSVFITVYVEAITNAVIRNNILSGGSLVHINASSVGCIVEGNILYCDFGRAIDLGETSVKVINNTCIGSNTAGIVGIRHNNASDTSCLIQNNILQNWETGVSATNGCTHSNNAYSNCSTNFSGGTDGGNNVTSALNLFSSLIPKSTSALKHVGVFILISQDRNKVIRNNPPSIGAYEFISERATAPTRGIR